MVSKTLFIVPNDAHYYKIIEILKQFYKFKITPRFGMLVRTPHLVY